MAACVAGRAGHGGRQGGLLQRHADQDPRAEAGTRAGIHPPHHAHDRERETRGTAADAVPGDERPGAEDFPPAAQARRTAAHRGVDQFAGVHRRVRRVCHVVQAPQALPHQVRFRDPRDEAARGGRGGGQRTGQPRHGFDDAGTGNRHAGQRPPGALPPAGQPRQQQPAGPLAQRRPPLRPARQVDRGGRHLRDGRLAQLRPALGPLQHRSGRDRL